MRIDSNSIYCTTLKVKDESCGFDRFTPIAYRNSKETMVDADTYTTVDRVRRSASCVVRES